MLTTVLIPKSKVGRVLLMAVIAIFSHVEFGQNGHEYGPYGQNRIMTSLLKLSKIQRK